MKRIYFDMDGTLAEWRQAASQEELRSKGYFSSLAPTEVAPFANMLAQEGDPQAEVNTLSAYLTEGYAYSDKNTWCDSHTPAIDKEHRLFVPYGENKAEFVMKRMNRSLTEDDILIDDHTPNLIEWQMAGGKAIKWLNGINGLNGIFKGVRVMMIPDLERAIFG